MLPTRSRMFASQIDSLPHQPVSLNYPEENDETMSDDFLPRALVEPGSTLDSEAAMDNDHRTPCGHAPAMAYKLPPPPPPRGVPARFPQTPFSSQTAAEVGAGAGGGTGAPGHYQWAWAYPSYASGREEGYPHSMPSCLPSEEYSSYPDEASYLQGHCRSLPGRHSPSMASLEQPSSLRSIPPAVAPRAHPPHPYACLPQPQPQPQPPPPVCCTQCHRPGHLRVGPIHQLSPHPDYHMPYKPSGPDHCGQVRTSSTQSEYGVPQPRHTSPRGTQLSMEQRKVFVTYEDDSEDHVKEIIKFVALLRHNGFDTHIDVFEQQLNSISKIDCTEMYIQEKDYLIIIAISPKYYEVVAGDSMFVERDERTLNTVYIHKQLQNEFIQNGCKNFRFIPILFPGAKKSHVPTWLRNTHVYSWPKHRDDILRRLMRVEKYNPPPIGELPTIVSIPI